jgi:hypothetical protein
MHAEIDIGSKISTTPESQCGILEGKGRHFYE